MISRKLTKWQELQDVLLDGTTQINDDVSGKRNNYASQLSQIAGFPLGSLTSHGKFVFRDFEDEWFSGGKGCHNTWGISYLKEEL